MTTRRAAILSDLIPELILALAFVASCLMPLLVV